MTYDAETRIYPVDPLHPDPVILRLAADALRRGGLVAFPTETVYGLGANAFEAEAVARIFAAKRRPANDPIIVHIHDLAQLDQIAVEVPPLAGTLAAAFWPGPLTFVLRRGERIPANVSAGMPTVAVRMPSGSVARALLQTVALPVAAPSANTFSRPSATTAAHVLQDLSGHVDVVLDGGATAIGLESTVLDLTGAQPVILRPGGVPLEALREIAADVQVKTHYLALDADAGASPGMLIKHYAPHAEMLLFDGEREAVLEAMRQRAETLDAEGKRVGVLAYEEDRAVFAGLNVHLHVLGALQNTDKIGAGLFAGLRALDAVGVDVILARTVEREGLGAAIDDRLMRAAEGHIVRIS
ncbi:MAG: threonylcarbamoyl-AMP synthase [Anaerolineae bacterium]|nr:threonylcarbamoyl-AMP synthase [Anaerolineae bacterium]